MLMDLSGERCSKFRFISWPNAVELTLTLLVVTFVMLLFGRVAAGAQVLLSIFGLWVAEAILDTQALVKDNSVAPAATGLRRFQCALVSCVYKSFCEIGHTWSIIRRGSILFFYRFDWWFGLSANYEAKTRAREFRRFSFLLGSIGVVHSNFRVSVILIGGLFCTIASVIVMSFLGPNTLIDPPPPQRMETTEADTDSSPLYFVFISDEKYARALATSFLSLASRKMISKYLYLMPA